MKEQFSQPFGTMELRHGDYVAVISSHPDPNWAAWFYVDVFRTSDYKKSFSGTSRGFSDACRNATNQLFFFNKTDTSEVK